MNKIDTRLLCHMYSNFMLWFGNPNTFEVKDTLHKYVTNTASKSNSIIVIT